MSYQPRRIQWRSSVDRTEAQEIRPGSSNRIATEESEQESRWTSTVLQVSYFLNPYKNMFIPSPKLHQRLRECQWVILYTAQHINHPELVKQRLPREAYAPCSVQRPIGICLAFAQS